MLKKLLLIIIIIFSLLFIYWLKSYRGVQLFENISLSDKFPFNYLYTPENSEPVIISGSEPGDVLINENFENGLMHSGFSHIWARDRGTVIRRIIHDQENDAKYLSIESMSERDWAIEHDKLIAVSYQEKFHYRGKLKIEDNATAAISIALLDGEMNTLNWSYAKKALKTNNYWKKLNNAFVIPTDVEYIKFRVTGQGKGQVYVDNLLLEKLDEQINSYP